MSLWKKLAEGRRNNEFFSEFLKNVPKNVKFNNSENVDGDFVRELMIFSIYLVIQDTNTVLNRNTYDLTDFLYKIAENSWWNEKYFLENIAIELFTHQLWDVCLVTSILYRFPYGRVGGVSMGGYAYPDTQITGRLYHFFWKLPNFSFRQFFCNSCYNLYLHQYQIPTKSHWWRGLRYTFAIFKHCDSFKSPLMRRVFRKRSKGLCVCCTAGIELSDIGSL